MSKQTALQKAIVELQSRIDENTTEDESMYLNGIIKQLTDLLPYEREVIEDVYEQADSDGSAETMGGMANRQYKGFNDYFNKTFTDNGND